MMNESEGKGKKPRFEKGGFCLLRPKFYSSCSSMDKERLSKVVEDIGER